MLLFRSEETVNAWCAAHKIPRRPLINLEQLWELAVHWYANRLSVESRRPAPDEMVSIFASIRDGRPHGMPAFGDKMTTEQVWQLTGYVRALGAMSASTAAPSRNDDLESRPAENRAPAAGAATPRAGW